MDEPTPKRRRIDQISSNSIHKPFRSPLKTNPDAINHTPSPSHIKFSVKSSSADPVYTPIKQPYLPSRLAHSSLSSSAHANQYTDSTSPSKPSASAPFAASTTQASTQAPTKAQAYSQQAHPSLQISRLRTDIDTLKQSLHILRTAATSTTSDTSSSTTISTNSTLQSTPAVKAAKAEKAERPSLPTLIHKWRIHAQFAAETLHETTAAKVESMGGVRALRAREGERRCEQRRREEDDAAGEEERRANEGERGGQFGGGTGEGGGRGSSDEEGGMEGMGKAERKMMREEEADAKEKGRVKREEAKRIQRQKEESMEAQQKEVEDEYGDGFTMEMMLKTMNVDLKVIGWDAKEQRWVD